MKELYNSTIQKVLGSAILFVFLFALFMTLFYVPAHAHMTGEMSGCPFMSLEEVVCSMNMLDHLASWKTAFTALTPTLVLLLLTAAAVIYVTTRAPNLLRRQQCRIVPLTRDIRERVYTYTYRPFQELFSNGILHPKVF